MKRSLLILGLSVSMVLLAATMVFAGVPGEGLGFAGQREGCSPETSLQMRIERLEKMVEEDQLSAEEAQEIKIAMAQRQASCTNPGDPDSEREKLGAGFGRTEQGQGLLHGARNGEGRFGPGQGRNR